MVEAQSTTSRSALCSPQVFQPITSVLPWRVGACWNAFTADVKEYKGSAITTGGNDKIVRSLLIASTMQKNPLGKVPRNLRNRVFLSLKIQKFSGGRTPQTPLLRTPLKPTVTHLTRELERTKRFKRPGTELEWATTTGSWSMIGARARKQWSE